MNRRSFLSLFSAGVAGIALEQAIPLGRVWSFPKKIVIANPGVLGRAYGFDWSDEVTVGSLTPIRIPAPLEIGDVVTIKQSLRFPGYVGPFIIMDVHESLGDLMFDLKAPRHNITGTAPGSALDPFPTVDGRRDSSHTPS